MVPGEGFEPTCLPLIRRPLVPLKLPRLEIRDGFEPSNNSFAGCLLKPLGHLIICKNKMAELILCLRSAVVST